MNQKFIITGAPGTGKTSIINELKKRGFSISKEISREIIADELKQGGDVLPWKNLKAFSERVALLRKTQFDNAPENKLHFFDRSIIDVFAYMKLDKICSKSLEVKLGETQYATTVFYTPIWKEIYKNDEERKENIEQANKIEDTLINAYTSTGYKLVKIPKDSIKNRVDFIISKT